MKIDRSVYKSRVVKNFRELLNYSVENYSKNIAYKYKKTPESKTIIEKNYQEVGNDVRAFSTALINRKLQGKKIAIIGSNRYEWCISYLAITTGGMIVVPIDKSLTDVEIQNLIKRSEVEAVIFDKKYLETLKIVKDNEKKKLEILICMDEIKDDLIKGEEINESKNNIKFESKTQKVEEWDNILIEGKAEINKGNTKYNEVKIQEDKMSIILFTSGTTSDPKGVMLSQRNICSDITNIAKYVKIYPTDTLLSFLPIHHTFECTITFLYGFYSGATVAFCDGLRYIAPNLKEYKISVFVAVPLVLETMYKKIQKAIEDQGKTKLINTVTKISNILLKAHIDIRKILFKKILDNFGGKLRVVLYGAAPMEKNTIIGYNNLGVSLIQGYGLTETSPVISAETDKEKRPGSIGLPLPSINIDIVNPDKSGVGEIIVKGPSIMLGYYKNEEKTKEAIKDEWFHTGDFGYIDDDGFVYITGRKNDIIVLRNGKNVYPNEIEALINKIPYISESLVFSREENKTDTMLCAKVVYNKELIEQKIIEMRKIIKNDENSLKDKDEYSNKKIEETIWKDIKEINKILPNYKHIKRIMVTDEPMEKTTTQKVKRNIELAKITK